MLYPTQFYWVIDSVINLDLNIGFGIAKENEMWITTSDIGVFEDLYERKIMMPMAGVEPAQLAPPPPQDGVSTNSTTSASITFYN